MTSDAERLAWLFRGRTDAWGHVEGRCVRAPLTAQNWMDHAYADGSVGVYPLDPENVSDSGELLVYWGATDIDRGDDMLILATNIRAVLRHAGITSWVERSKGKGYHVLVFMQHRVPAVVMRNALLVAHQIAGVPPTEVYPKQTVLTGAGYGNYLNVPYAKLWADEGRRVVLDDTNNNNVMPLGEFLNDATANMASDSALRHLAGMYREPPKVVTQHSSTPWDGTLPDLTRRLSGLGFTIFKSGPLAGADRSGTLMHLLYILQEDGFTADEASALIVDADARWGKFSQRADGKNRLAELLRKVYP